MDACLLLVSLAAAGAVLAVGGTPVKKTGKGTIGAVILFAVFVMLLAIFFGRMDEVMTVKHRNSPASAPAVRESTSPGVLQPVVCVDEIIYFSQVESIVETLAVSLLALSDVDGIRDPAGYALRHEAELRTAASVIRKAAVTAHGIKGVPPVAHDAHELFCQAMLCYYRSMFNFNLGLDALALQSDTAAAVFFELAMSEMTEGNALLEQAFKLWGQA